MLWDDLLYHFLVIEYSTQHVKRVYKWWEDQNDTSYSEV